MQDPEAPRTIGPVNVGSIPDATNIAPPTAVTPEPVNPGRGVQSKPTKRVWKPKADPRDKNQ